MLHATEILQETQSNKEILQPNYRNGVLSCPLMFLHTSEISIWVSIFQYWACAFCCT